MNDRNRAGLLSEMKTLRIRLMGKVEASWGKEPLALTGNMSMLLALVATAPDRRAGRDWLAGMIWGSKDDARGRHNLRQLIARLRQLDCAEAFSITERDFGFVHGQVETDVDALEMAARSSTTNDKSKALAACRGPFGEGLPAGDEGLEEHIRFLRDHFNGLLVTLAIDIGTNHLEEGEPERALGTANQAIRIDRFREDAHRLVMRALADLDRRSEALRHYDALAEFLSDEIDSEPDELTQSLAASLKRESNVLGGNFPAATLVADQDRALQHLSHSVAHRDVSAILVVSAKPPEEAGFDRPAFQIVLDGGGPNVTALSLRKGEVVLHFAELREAAAFALRLMPQITPWKPRAGLHPTQAGNLTGQPDHPDIRTARQVGRIVPVERIGLSVEARDRLGATFEFQAHDLFASSPLSPDAAPRAFVISPSMPAAEAVTQHIEVELRPTIAVVPFLTLTTDIAYRALGDLLADELIASLCRRSEIRVIARLSTAAFRAEAIRSEDIRRHLGADFGATGTCTIVGDRIRVLVEFNDLVRNETLWTESLQCSVGTALMTDGIVDEIASRMVATILRKTHDLVRSQPVPTLENSSLLLGAITLMHQLTPQRFGMAGHLLETLAERCPRHPAPHAWQGMFRLLRASQGWSDDPLADSRRAKDASARALDLEPDSALALAVAAHVATQFDHDFEESGQALDRALVIEPNNGLAWLFRSARHAFLGEGPNAIRAATMASSLSPLDPRRWLYDSLAATAALGADDHEAAIALAKRSLQGNAMHTSTYRALIIAEHLSGRQAEACAHAERFMTLQPGFSVSQYRQSHPTTRTRIGHRWANALRAAGVQPGHF